MFLSFLRTLFQFNCSSSSSISITFPFWTFSHSLSPGSGETLIKGCWWCHVKCASFSFGCFHAVFVVLTPIWFICSSWGWFQLSASEVGQNYVNAITNCRWSHSSDNGFPSLIRWIDFTVHSNVRLPVFFSARPVKRSSPTKCPSVSNQLIPIPNPSINSSTFWVKVIRHVVSLPVQ